LGLQQPSGPWFGLVVSKVFSMDALVSASFYVQKALTQPSVGVTKSVIAEVFYPYSFVGYIFRAEIVYEAYRLDE